MKKTKSRIIWLLVVLGVVSTLGLQGCSNTEYRNRDYKIKFLTGFGNIGVFSNYIGTLSLRYVVENYKKYEEDMIQKNDGWTQNTIPNVQLDNTGLIVKNVRVSRAYEHEDYAFYYLDVDLESKTLGDFPVKNIKLGENSYPIGDIVFECKENTSGPTDVLIIKDASKDNFGRGIGDYSLTLKNTTGKRIMVNKATNKKYGDSNVKTILKDGEAVTAHLAGAFIYDDDQEVSMTISFTVPTDDNFDIHYFTPEIQWEYDGQHFTLPLEPFYCGVSISDRDFVDICTEIKNGERV